MRSIRVLSSTRHLKVVYFGENRFGMHVLYNAVSVWWRDFLACTRGDGHPSRF